MYHECNSQLDSHPQMQDPELNREGGRRKRTPKKKKNAEEEVWTPHECHKLFLTDD